MERMKRQKYNEPMRSQKFRWRERSKEVSRVARQPRNSWDQAWDVHHWQICCHQHRCTRAPHTLTHVSVSRPCFSSFTPLLSPPSCSFLPVFPRPRCYSTLTRTCPLDFTFPSAVFFSHSRAGGCWPLMFSAQGVLRRWSVGSSVYDWQRLCSETHEGSRRCSGTSKEDVSERAGIMWRA